MPVTPKFDKFLKRIREDDSGTVLYITNGSNGITTIRMEDSSGGIWDATMSTDGHWITAAVTGIFSLLLETGDRILLENGDRLLME